MLGQVPTLRAIPPFGLWLLELFSNEYWQPVQALF